MFMWHLIENMNEKAVDTSEVEFHEKKFKF